MNSESRRRSRAVAILLMFVGASGLPAADALGADVAQMQSFMKSPFYQGLVSRALAGLPSTVFQRCVGLVSDGSKVTTLDPISFGTDGYPNAGSWKQSFPVSGCGNDTVLNLYFSATPEEKINTVVGIPGLTHADLVLQKDAVKYADIGAHVAVKSCARFDVTNSSFIGYGIPALSLTDPGPGNRRPWREMWALYGCGRSADVPIDFIPDKTGIRIVQPAAAIETSLRTTY